MTLARPANAVLERVGIQSVPVNDEQAGTRSDIRTYTKSPEKPWSDRVRDRFLARSDPLLGTPLLLLAPVLDPAAVANDEFAQFLRHEKSHGQKRCLSP